MNPSADAHVGVCTLSTRPFLIVCYTRASRVSYCRGQLAVSPYRDEDKDYC